MSEPGTIDEKPKKFCYIGAPAIFALDAACRIVNDSFESYGCYLVGSSLRKADWRDVDIRMIMKDEDFFILFPDAHDNGSWEFDSRWMLLTISISGYLSKVTQLPIDFQFQPQSFANKYFPEPLVRHPLGIKMLDKKINIL